MLNTPLPLVGTNDAEVRIRFTVPVVCVMTADENKSASDAEVIPVVAPRLKFELTISELLFAPEPFNEIPPGVLPLV